MNAHAAEIFTLLGAIVGAVATIIGQCVFSISVKNENLQKERSVVATRLYSLHAKLLTNVLI